MAFKHTHGTPGQDSFHGALEAYLTPHLQRNGLADLTLIRAWPAIVGSKWARLSYPFRLSWPTNRGGGPRDGRAGRGKTAQKTSKPRTAEPSATDGPSQTPPAAPLPTLFVWAHPAIALEIEALAPVLIERINARLGYRAVGKLAIRQSVSIASSA